MARECTGSFSSRGCAFRATDLYKESSMSQRRRPRVLVVENDDDTRNLFANFLEYEGCEVETARHPDQVSNASGFDLILMDVHFAGGDPIGLEWVRARRAQGQLPSTTRVVFATGYPSTPIETNDPVLFKPIELTAVRKILHAGETV